MAHTEHTPPKYNLSGSLLYSLHIRPGGRNVECNQFSITIQPDYGGGITQEDAENEAARIHSILTEYDQLKAELEASKEREAKLRAALESIRDQPRVNNNYADTCTAMTVKAGKALNQ